MRTLLAMLILAAAAAPMAAQAMTIYFSTDGTEGARSGAAGTTTYPGNAAATFRDEQILAISPSTSGPDAVAVASSYTWASWFGDEDGDGNYTERVAGNLDALALVSGAASPPTIFDFWISFSDDVGPFGFLPGTILRDGDVFRLLPGGGVAHFVTEAQLAVAMGTTVDFDVNGFVVNPANGDLYWTMTTTVPVNGIALEDGGIVRLPASGYTPRPDGTVLSVVPGAAQIALHEVHVNVFYFVAGMGTVGDLDGIALAPQGGTFQGPNGTLPNFWFVGDSPTSGPTIVSTVGGGTIPVVNGVAMTGGLAFGLSATDLGGLPNSTLTALAWSSSTLATRPRVLDMRDAALETPGNLKLDAAGFAPGPNLHIFANLGVASPAGSFTPRTALPGTSPLAGAGSFRVLFVDDLFDPLFAFTAMLPPVSVDALGYGSVSYPLPALPVGIAITVQAIDATNLALSHPVIVVTQ
jgi:hypothetical protein